MKLGLELQEREIVELVIGKKGRENVSKSWNG